MAYKNHNQLTFADTFIPKTKGENPILSTVLKNIDWKPILTTLEQYYEKGNAKTGRVPYSPLLLFKVLLLQTWYGLSDLAAEAALNDRLSFMQFCGLGLGDKAPDHSTIARFRQQLAEKNAFESLLSIINDQFAQKGLIIKEGIIVDAYLTQSRRVPKKKPLPPASKNKTPPGQRKTTSPFLVLKDTMQWIAQLA